MFVYSFKNFLVIPNEESTILRLIDNEGKSTKNINPRSVKLMYVENNILNIDVNRLEAIKLMFSTFIESKLALQKLSLWLGILKSRIEFAKDETVISHEYNDISVGDIPDTGKHFTGYTITNSPRVGSYILLFLNGQEIEVSATGSGDDAPAFFAAPNTNGTEVRDFSSPDKFVRSGDELWWNSDYADYNEGIDAGSRLSIYYLR
jgi:hypothetical protein